MRPFSFVAFLFICLVYDGDLYAQSVNVMVRNGSSDIGVDAATVSVLKAMDSSWVRSEITDANGNAVFADIHMGKYVVVVSAIGYRQQMQPLEVTEARTYVCTLRMEKESTALNEISVTGKKPFIEMSLGKTVVNIEGSTTTAGSNVLELMSRLPGVLVDQGGAISMHGKAGVLVLIDDRPTYLAGEDLADYLKTITAEEVARIELVTQPGAKYDASGNTGVINVILKKNKRHGWNGSITLSEQQGVYFHRNENLLVSYKKNKLNLSLNASDMEAIGFADWRQHLYYIDGQGAISGSNITHSTPKERFSNQALRVSADYDLSDKTTIGMSVRGSYHPNITRSNILSSFYDNGGNAMNYDQINGTDGHIRKDVMLNAYMTQKTGKAGKLDINFDHLTFSKNADQQMADTTYDKYAQALPDPLMLNSRQQTLIHLYSLKGDYVYSLPKGMKLEAGLKVSSTTMDFDAAFNIYKDNAWINDTGKTNHFLYREQINAGYVTIARQLNAKWDTKLGIRAEQTVSSGLQYVHSQRFDKHYVSLFPTAFISYKKDSNNQFELNYGRRVDRPEYKLLNPFVYYSFQNIYNVGNPELMPEYTSNTELKHSYKNMLITALTYSYTSDVIQGFTTVNDTSKISYNSNRNIASNSSVYLNVYFNKDIFKWWSLNLGASVFYADLEGCLNNLKTKVEWNGYYAECGSRFDFGHGWKADVYANYASSGRWSLTSTFDPIVVVEFGASKKVNDHWLLKFHADDPFYIFRLGGYEHGVNYTASSQYRNASQSFSLSVTYTFGGQQNAAKEHSIDEAKRL